MAITPVRLKDGTERYVVRFVVGGGRRGPGKKEVSETFASRDGRNGAEAFQLAVREAGNQYPEGYTPGWGWGEPPKERPDLLVDDVSDKWFAYMYQRANIGRIDTYTVERYESCYRLHIAEYLGAMPFNEVARQDIRDWIEQLVTEGWSAKSIKNWHSGTLSPLFRWAQEELALRQDNPSRGIDLPPINEDMREMMFFDPSEWALMRAHLAPDAWLLYDFLTMTGARIGEVLALRKSDCTIKSQDEIQIKIQRAWRTRAKKEKSPVREDEHENKKWMLGFPKQERPRKIVVVGTVAARLAQILASKSPKDYVFTREGDRSTGCPWRYDDFHYERWKPAREAAERDGYNKENCNPHMLRHTCVVWTFDEDKTIRTEEIAERLGHITIGGITWNRYGGELNKDASPRVARAMQSAMARALKEFATQRDDDDGPEAAPESPSLAS